MTSPFTSGRREDDDLASVQTGNRDWWQSTPMTYDWSAQPGQPRTLEWFDDQDRRAHAAHAHFATRQHMYDSVIPFERLEGKRVLEIGPGAGLHAELMVRAGAQVTAIDLTEAAIATTRDRMTLKGLQAHLEVWDAEQPRPDFDGQFDFVWSWGVIHHSARTARIVRNVADWLRPEGEFRGMVYHRGSSAAAAAVFRRWVLARRLGRESIDESLWAASDGHSARFYPPDQWRDLLLGFFEDSDVHVTGLLADAVPVPGRVRGPLLRVLPARTRDRLLAHVGNFLVFEAHRPLR